MKTRLEKFDVCEDCLSVGITDTNCSCSYGSYKSIKLEFEVCDCCGQILHDGQPADTPFNETQLKKQ
jgi:hypothetical protein